MGQPQREDRDDLAEAMRLYEQYVKPLETDHWGEYVMVSPDGQMLLGSGLDCLLDAAQARFGPSSWTFKVGDIATETLR